MGEAQRRSAERTLENLRTRLLDLTARNRLINFRHTRGGSLRVVDELPDQLAETLLGEAEMTFAAVPEPTEEELIEAGYLGRDEETGELRRLRPAPDASEWARHLGIQTSYEMPLPASDDVPAKHSDNEIQTLLYPYELEARLKTLSQKAESAIQEMGANILYMAFGFLEWYESKDHHNPRLAPLFLIPVRLQKGRLNPQTRTYEYRLRYSGEEIMANLSLREKLRADFAMALPDLDEGTSPEAYFNEVQAMIEASRTPRWRVRRQVVLALLNFSKLLMYLDLDPARWPEENGLLDHPVVRRFLEGYEEVEDAGDGVVDCGEEYPIDEVPKVHERYPLIEDADSSQHSALIDAIDGRDLVIEGPPGTGKSQTITNLIAAAMAQRKRVLFVAEKLAALEVVRSRLDAAGLGTFCLELHSHKSQKRKVLDEIQERLQKRGQYRPPAEIAADIARFEELKARLADHARRINTPWKQTRLTPHEIFMAAARYREEVGIDLERLHPQDFDAANYNPEQRRRQHDEVAVYRRLFQTVTAPLGDAAPLDEHPWFGVGNSELQLFDQDQVAALLESWQAGLQALNDWRETAAQTLACAMGALPDTMEGLRNLHAELQSLLPLAGDELLARLPELRGDRLRLARKIQALFRDMQATLAELSQEVGAEALSHLEQVEEWLAASGRLRDLVAGDMDLGRLAEITGRLDALQQQLQALSEPMGWLAERLGEAGATHLGPTARGLENFRTLLRLIAQLPASGWRQRDALFDEDELDELLPRLRAALEDLRSRQETLRDLYLIDNLPTEDEIHQWRTALSNGGLLGWLRADWRQARRRLRALAAQPGIETRDLVAQLPSLEAYAGALRRLEQAREYPRALGEHFQGLETDLEQLETLRNWYREVRKTYGAGFGPQVALGEAVLNLDESVARTVRGWVGQGMLSQLDECLEDLDTLKHQFASDVGFEDADRPLIGEAGLLTALTNRIRKETRACGPLVHDDNLSLAQLVDRVERLAQLYRLQTAWERARQAIPLFEELGLEAGLDADNEAALAALEHTLRLAEAIEQDLSLPVVRELIYAQPDTATFDTLARLDGRLAASLEQEQRAGEAFAQRVELDRTAWTQRCGDTLDGLTARNQRALEHLPLLDGWLQYLRQRARLAALGLAPVSEAAEQGRVPVEKIEAAWLAGVYDRLAREILAEEPALERFSGRGQEAVQDQFRRYDERLKQLQCERIAWKIDQIKVPEGVRGARVSEYTERVLLEHECAKKKRHIPIRQLLGRAGNALLALKPCFMMGPMSVAQYLAPGQLRFDLVVMDEASQIKPQDALGAIARGGQLVVVGDPRQLPPTSFFDRIVDDGDEDPSALEESESILDATLPMFPVRRLRWHYRSRHESLIAFSNRFFYDDDLVLFPSPFSDSPDYGIRYTRLHRGCFVNRRNLEEARVIAEAVREHFRHSPDETLGVVAMSAEQRLQLERAIETLAKEDPAFEQALEADAQRRESLFVKNLENVQGDERDVIFISMTYGPKEPGGRVMQRFGPINSDVGWRRLNVLFTRSRKRMQVFSSMGSDDIVVGPTTRRGVQALRDFLAYCETGLLHRSARPGQRPPDSDFEVAVMNALRQEGFECVPQVGVAGFFIDIAVVDPGNPGRYLMGIECDGATYHSAKSTRDRDRLRQAVLERLGWRIRRIWSTDWFRNPHGELAPIIRELHQLKTEAPPTEPAESEQIEALVEQVETQEQALESLVYGEGEDLTARLQRLDREVIRPAHPDTPEHRRLLRPAMLEALVEYMPTSRAEFLEFIPGYLRQATDPAEGRYLDQVFEIINGWEE